MSDPETHVTFKAPDIAEIAPLFPGYEIEILIATGGMGAVYRAVQKSLERTVAIKILPYEFSNDAAFCAGFEAEAKAMARLNHPNLIGVYDFGEINGMLYIIMEYVPGQSLFHSSNGMAIDPGEVIRLVTGICEGLAHAHEHGILHRDIKPSNILLDLNAQPKIGDFGLARPVETQVQEGDEIFGTPHYTAPEVVNAPHSVDQRADIFSVGVLLHELLTGHLPAEDPRSASAIAHCDPRFDAIVRRATSPIPENRYNSATEIAKDLHVIATSAGPRVLQTAAPHSARRPLPGGFKRRPIKQSSGNPAVVLLIIALIAAAAWFYLNGKNKRAPVPDKAIPDNSVPVNPQSPPTPEPTVDNSQEPSPPRDTEPVIPEPVPEDHPRDNPNQVPEPRPAPEENTSAVLPKFDVPGFFEHARNIMHERATPLIASRDQDLQANLTDFERGAKRLTRKIEFRGRREQADEALDSFIRDCKDDQNRIPAELHWRLEDVPGMSDLHDEFYKKQETIDALLMQSLAALAPTYTLGLEKQIERLETADDPAAIKIIEAEIEKNREDKDYFPNLMLGGQD